MLGSLVIGADKDLQEKLQAAFQESGRLGTLRAVESYPEGLNLERILRANAPQVLFVCADHLEDALAVRRTAEATIPGLPLVAFGHNSSQLVLLELMKAGVREYLSTPFRTEELIELADRLEERLSDVPVSLPATDMLFSFLPAKPGVGASTVAMNVSVELSKSEKVLLADFDLNSGLIAFMMKVASRFSLVDAAEKSDELDEVVWPKLVSEVGNLHVLPAGRSDLGFRIDPVQIRRLIGFARRQYGAICVDLSGNMEKYSVELMHESKRIFLVTTPEIPPLHLARDRFNLLRGMDLGDRVSVVLNRYHRRSTVSVAQIEDLLGAPVYETLPNSYLAVHKSLVEGKPVEPSSELGKGFAKIARRMLNPEDGKKSRKKSFIEHFAVLPARY